MTFGTYSGQCQDLFVRAVLDNKTNGTYVEIGGADPIEYNNTFYLEEHLNWRGVSVEFDSKHTDKWPAIRNNPCFCTDALKIDYDKFFTDNNLGPHIDYLQLDIDPPANTFAVLNAIDFSKYSFSVITYEHDCYAGGNNEMVESRKILESHGYTRVVTDVEFLEGRSFEDWYVNEKYMPNDNWRAFVGQGVNMNPTQLSQKDFDNFSKFVR